MIVFGFTPQHGKRKKHPLDGRKTEIGFSQNKTELDDGIHHKHNSFRVSSPALVEADNGSERYVFSYEFLLLIAKSMFCY